ncbi:MAG: bifunctional UDP-N-acetylglucosamine diphosphorylase/glucosamine-1-phosphate N-acetyltransferase GlmU [Nocardioides sp.]
MGDLTAIVLAAGAGTRMKSATAKVLHAIGGRSMVGHVLAAVNQLGAERVIVVVGHQRDQVRPHIEAIAPQTLFAVQTEQLGTGHAARVAVDAAQDASTGTVLVLYADTPLLEAESLTALVDHHRETGAAVTVLTGVVEDPFGYGRIVRDATGAVVAIVEQKDADEEQRTIQEINSGIFAFDAAFLTAVLPRLGNNNAAGEYYLTDVVAAARAEGLGVEGFQISDVMQTEGVNDRVQLAALGAELNRRVVTRWMRSGVSMVDPDSTWIDVTARLASDVTIAGPSHLLGDTQVDSGAVIGPYAVISNAHIRSGEVVPPFTTIGPRA